MLMWTTIIFVLVIDVIIVLFASRLLKAYRRSNKASSPEVLLPSSNAEDEIECISGSPTSFRSQACALNFTSETRSKVIIPGDCGLSNLEEFTVNMVIGFHSFSEKEAGILSDSDGHITLSVKDGHVHFQVVQIGHLDSFPVAVSHELALGRWYLISAVFNSGEMSLFVDGVRMAKSTVTSLDNPICGPISQLQLGCFRNGVYQSDHFDGAIAHVEIWSKAFTPKDVRSVRLLSKKMAKYNEKLLVLYSLEGATDGAVLLDESGNFNHGMVGSGGPKLARIECSPIDASAPEYEKPAPVVKRTRSPRRKNTSVMTQRAAVCST